MTAGIDSGASSDRSALTPSRVGILRTLKEAWAAVSLRPARSALTALGTVVGTAAFIATIGIATTVGAQISEQFDLLRATEVIVQDSFNLQSEDKSDFPGFPPDTDTRLSRLAGVRAGGILWRLESPGVTSTFPAGTGRQGIDLPVVAASPGAVEASIPLISGRAYDTGHADRASRVVVVGAAAARQLQLPPLDRLPAVFIGGVPFTVIGVIEDVGRNPDLLLSLTIPYTTALELWGPQSVSTQVLIDVLPGAAHQVGTQVPTALRPEDPSRYHVLVPPDPQRLRQSVEQDTRNLFLALAVLSLGLGTVSIANATLVAVMERRAEIGLRRALGARRRHVVGQILAEATLVGTASGILGTLLGVAATVAVAAMNLWTPTLPLWAVAVSPVLGAVAGVVAGLRPSYQASRIAPADALRAS